MQEPIPLDDLELSVLTDQQFFPAKFRIGSKLDQLLNLLRDQIKQEIAPLAPHLPDAFDTQQGKVSRGENYNSFPYRVLDFPKAMSQDDVFTFRTLVLFGHHVSYHLILSGRFKPPFQERIIAHSGSLPESMMLSAQTTPWEWELNETTYVPVRALQEEKAADALRQHPFLKISFFAPLGSYMDIPKTGREIWKLWQAVLFGA
ncbi:MAG: hypothetical protein AAGI38_14560 [Bacteroidota bacterium]